MMRRIWTSRLPESVHNYAGVFVPLEEAHLYSYSARCGRVEFEETPDDSAGDELRGGDGNDGVDGKDRDDEQAGMLEMNVAEYSIEGLRREVRSGEKGKQWTEYEMKSKLLNKAIQDIGMGMYNWQLFVLCGFGWFADKYVYHLGCMSHFLGAVADVDSQGVSLTLPSLSAEFGVPEKTVRYTTSALFLGLCLGSFFWGIGSDIMGRRIAFNTTLLITSVFGIGSAYASTWGQVCFMFAALGFGVGGNLPVDGALFLEFLPDANSSLLTLLSVWWPAGQLASSLIAWFFMANWPVDQGWRQFIITIGVITFIMFFVRFFIFRLFESPKYLLIQNRQAEAVAVVHGIAYRNGTKTWLTEDILDAVVDESASHEPAQLSTTGVLKNKLASFSSARIRPFFSNKTLGLATSLIWFCWATIGMGYPLFNAFLPQYLSHRGAPPTDSETQSSGVLAETYRSYAITSIMGVPGSLIAAYTVDHKSPFLGRRGTLATSTLLSGIFLFVFVEFGSSPGSQLAFSCIEAFAQNIMYGVLYAFTPEIFPAPVRGAGTGVASFLNRVTGLVAPVIAATIPGDGATAPIFLSGALILSAFVAICLIPIETRGRQRL